MNQKCADVGGQALIEGVMMKGNGKISMAVRKKDGTISIDTKEDLPITKKYKLLKIPFIRGVGVLADALVIGVKAITYSAELFEEGASEDGFDRFMKKVFKEKAESVMIAVSIIIAIGMAIGLFILMPAFLAEAGRRVTDSRPLLNLFEGVIRIGAFVGYVLLISRLKDIKRVFSYHGAEHKAIYTYESGQDLTVENAQKFTTLHPRCGTNFMLLVMLIAIMVFSFFRWNSPLEKALIRIALMPLIAGISYEVLKFSAKRDSLFFRIIKYPGLMLQKITTNEPDDSQVEVALMALAAVVGEDVSLSAAEGEIDIESDAIKDIECAKA